MICGLLPVTEGSIRFTVGDGQDPKSMIGYCPQENIFYPRLTCLEQMHFIGQMHGMPARSIRTRSFDLLTMLGLQDKIHVMAAALSGGMKRRLNICLALVHDPEILILDEPEAGLDPQSRILVRDFIRDFGKEKTVLLTTHNMDEADRMAQRIAIMDYGKLLLLDTPQNLKRTIGEGDILEIVPGNGNEDLLRRFTEQASKIVTLVNSSSASIVFRHQQMLEALPSVRQIADGIGLPIAEIRLRENTLEDVFIYLTGRNLRQ
jgi:ABC-2 type transport system ATP-binding protein